MSGKRTHEQHSDFVVITSRCSCGNTEVYLCEQHAARFERVGMARCSKCQDVTSILARVVL